jgi:hypothetical protein
MDAVDSIQHNVLLTITADGIRCLADRLSSGGISSLATSCPREEGDLIRASRVMRALFRCNERCTGRQVEDILIAGGA